MVHGGCAGWLSESGIASPNPISSGFGRAAGAKGSPGNPHDLEEAVARSDCQRYAQNADAISFRAARASSRGADDRHGTAEV
jgi:hypothetical protein